MKFINLNKWGAIRKNKIIAISCGYQEIEKQGISMEYASIFIRIDSRDNNIISFAFPSEKERNDAYDLWLKNLEEE